VRNTIGTVVLYGVAAFLLFPLAVEAVLLLRKGS